MHGTLHELSIALAGAEDEEAMEKLNAATDAKVLTDDEERELKAEVKKFIETISTYFGLTHEQASFKILCRVAEIFMS